MQVDIVTFLCFVLGFYLKGISVTDILGFSVGCVRVAWRLFWWWFYEDYVPGLILIGTIAMLAGKTVFAAIVGVISLSLQIRYLFTIRHALGHLVLLLAARLARPFQLAFAREVHRFMPPSVAFDTLGFMVVVLLLLRGIYLVDFGFSHFDIENEDEIRQHFEAATMIPHHRWRHGVDGQVVPLTDWHFE
ncbi:uncharacterized protein F4807DRAFT_151765 [Annulohypoxylon truncatum]|uniref:uncharacterized protein n=1 Tax=Annulohypoxylon truncatum TaxID=327061 RepID=UPI002007DE1C|nr:uncharacterized protein F4807DRAFT_151765 [Annulohypoxylon truncatum]KAI1208420.1 hypothetical protein F4807DRAFT_151765 [Annulohypoxylon truncatum]